VLFGVGGFVLGLSSNGVVGEALLAHIVVVPDVAAVEDDLVSEFGFHLREVWRSELVPLGAEH
jgi:hypothetical protein